MNWKAFLAASVSAALLAVPQNLFSCGGTEDPYDYYTSFFSKGAGTSAAYEPFYYTSLLTFYNDWDWDKPVDSMQHVNKRIVAEWATYTGSSKTQDAVDLVYNATVTDLTSLLTMAQNGRASLGALANNSAARALATGAKAEAVRYLLFANKTEGLAEDSGWEQRKRDSLKLNTLISEAQDGYAKATEPFVKNKWAFQRCKLAFYNNRHGDCIKWYDAHFTDENGSAVNELALAYKGGSLYRTGRKKEAAYAFSKTFALSHGNKRSNFIGFMWATDYCNPALLNDYLTLCQNNEERANMLSLFALHTSVPQLATIEKVYSLYPASPLLPLLATREINKLEEQYFTPRLSKEPGGRSPYYTWDWRYEDDKEKSRPTATAVTATASVFEKMMGDAALPNRDLYAAGAAYLHFMAKDYAKAKATVSAAKGLQAGAKMKDQFALIQLLTAVNESNSISPETEAQLLPSIKWLVEKAKKDKEYAIFSRNFFSQVLAQRYEQQKDIARAALAYGMADGVFIQRPENEDYYNYYNYYAAVDFIRAEMATADLLKLYETTTSPKTEAEKFFVQNNSIKRDAVVDVIGTSHLRDRAYKNAIEWFGKAGKLEPLVETQYNYTTGKETTVNVDPLHDYLNDWQRLSKSSPKAYTKLTLAQKMVELQAAADNPATANKAKAYYTLASALYNMSYYGNSWGAVAYNRSGTDWNEGVYKQPWHREYYGVYAAKDWYQKAYEVATDKEYKAACLFMVAKCAQRQVAKPPYNWNDYDKYEKEEAAFQKKFMNNPLFAQFKSEFGTTKFYQYAYNRCSYLRDYVGKTSATKKPAVNKRG